MPNSALPESLEQGLVVDLARTMVERVAPQELPLFLTTSTAYLRNPERVSIAQPPKEDMLGFGLEATVSFLTPVALAIATEVVTLLIAEIKKSLSQAAASAISDAVKRMFRKTRLEEKSASTAGVPPLTAPQVARIRELALDKARKLNLSESQAGLLADAVLGSLAIP